MSRTHRAPLRNAAAARKLRTPAAARSAWGWAGAGAVLGALGAGLLFAPAHWLAGGVARASGGQLQLLQPRGTVWNGSAQLVLTGGASSQDATALPGRVHWRLRPTLGGLHAQLQAACCTPAPLQLQVQARWGGAHLTVADHQS